MLTQGNFSNSLETTRSTIARLFHDIIYTHYMLQYYIVETTLTSFLLFSFSIPYQTLYYDVRSSLDT